MITEKTNDWRSGLSSLAKGLARVLPGSGLKKQSGSSGAYLAVFTAFATLSLLFTPNTTLAQDAALRVSFEESNYTAIENGAAAMVTVTLDQPADRTVTIPITTNPAMGDFSLSLTHVAFAPGEDSRTISVTASDDDNTADERVTLSFGTLPTGVSAGSPSSAAVMIRDDDLKQLVLSFGATTYDAHEGGADARVTITVNTLNEEDSTLSRTTTDRDLRFMVTGANIGSTVAGDWEISGVDESDNVVIAAGQGSQTVTVKAKPDPENDVDSITVSIGATLPEGVSTTGGLASTTVNLRDNNRVTVSFSEDKYEIDEGGTASVMVNIAPAPTADQSVPVTFSPAARNNGPFTVQVGGSDFSSGDRLTLTGGTGTITVTAAEDDDDMADHTIRFSLGGLPANTIYGANRSTTVEIDDNDDPETVTPVVQFDLNNTTSVREGSSVQLRVSINPPPEDEVTVDITPGGDAVADDFEVPEDVTFAAGERVKTITVTNEADTDITPETLTLTLANPDPADGATIGTDRPSHSLTLLDDGFHTVTISSDVTEVTEGNTTPANLTVTLDPANTTRAFRIPITVSPSRGDFTIAGADFDNNSVTFAANETSKTFTVVAKDDADSDDEEVTFTVNAVSQVKVGSNKSVKIALTDATRPTLSFGASSYIATENGDPATVTVTLDPPSPKEVTVPITATGGTDGTFLLSADELVFPANTGSQTITVVATADNDLTSNSVTLGFGTPEGQGILNNAGVHQTTTVTLADDGQRAVFFGAATYDATEGGSAGTAGGADEAVTVTVTLSEALTTGSATVPITIMPASGDFEVGPNTFNNTLTFDSTTGASLTFTITAEDDDDRDNETITLGLGALPLSLRAGSPSTSKVTIMDDETAPAGEEALVQFGAATYTATEGGAAAMVEVTLDRQLDDDVEIAFTNNDLAGIETTISGKNKVAFAAGETRQMITVTAEPDINTANETVTLTLDATGMKAEGVTTAGGQLSTSIILVDDGQTKGTVAFTSATFPATEATPASVTIDLTRAAGDTGPISIPITTSPASGDFILSPPNMVTWAADDSAQKTISVSMRNDKDVEADDMEVKLELGPVPADLIPTRSSTKVALQDDDRGEYTLTIAAAETNIGEDGEKTDITITLVPPVTTPATTEADRDFTIPITIDDTGTATVDEDFTLSATEVVFNKGDKGGKLSKKITLTAVDDIMVDATPLTVVLNVDDDLPGGVTGPGAGVTVTIDENDTARTINFGMATYAAVEGGASAMIVVSLDAQAGRDITLPITTDPMNGPFELSPTELVFGEKDQHKTITVTATADNDGEDSMVELSFTNKNRDAVGISRPPATTDTATVTLVDDRQVMGTVSFGAATYEAMEDGDAAMVMVNLDPPLPSGSRHSYTIPVSGWPMNGAAPGDFMLSANSVTFGPGESSKTITVTAVDNTTPVTNNGAVKLIFGAMPGDALPEGIVAGDPTETTVTLVDDDRNEGIVAYFMPATATAAEGGDAGMVSVGLDLGEGIASLDREISLPITVSSDGDDGDYTVEPMSVTFPAGATAGAEVWAPITVTANLDDDNDSETVTLGLGSLPLGVTAGSTAEQSATAVVTLEDDGQAALTVAFGAAEYMATEGGDAATVTVSLSAAADRDITIPITATPATGSEASYEAPMEVMIASGAMSADIMVTASHDEDTEDGSVTLGLGDLPAHVSAGDQATTMVTLTDDGLVPLKVIFASATYTATENGDAATVSVILNRPADREVTVPITMDPEDGPFDLSADEVTFGVGDNRMNITVTAVEDEDIVDDMVTLGFDLSGLERVNMGEQSTTVVTLSDDMLVPVTVSFGAANYTATEGGAAATVMVSLDKAPARSVTIPITTDPASGSFELSAEQVTFAANETSQEVTVTATLDADQDDGSVTLGLGDLPDRVTEGAISSTMVALTDDGLVPVAVSFDAAEYSAMEGGDAATVTVNLSADPERDVTIEIAATPATGDFEISAMEVMFSAGNMSQTITVMATLDADVDDDMVNLSLVNMPDRVTAGANTSAAVTLVDDGLVPVVVSFDASEYLATEGGAAATVTVNLDQDPNRDVTVPITTDPANGDFELSATEVMFSAGNMSQTITVTATSDDDVDDEMVMLGLGDLPGRVTAGDPATAAVSLIDKGYTVTFAIARQTVRESERGTVTANISPAANGSVSVPLSVTHQGGATAADYSGVPGSLAFSGGSSQASFTVSVMADEENDPGESIDVSFGSLPDKVNAGDITMTTVEFEQFRTAEQFSRTLQAALAVVAGAMGDSAVNAIETRFERFRENMGSASAAADNFERTYGHLSDMESPSLAMNHGSNGMDNGFVPMATNNPATGLNTGSTGYGRSHTSGSYEEAISLGALASTARPGESVIASGYGMAPNGEQDVNFSGVAFEMAMEHGDEGKFSPVVWVQGDLQRFDGEIEDIGMDFDGGLDAIHLGVDLYANGQTLAGVSVMQSWGDLDYTDDGVDGSLDSSMSTFHPYVYFQPNSNLGVWGILGFGSGSIDVSEPDRTHEFDADFSMFAGGVRSVLNRRDNNELGLSADAFMAELSTDAADDIPGVKGEAQRARVMVDWLSNSTMAEGQDLAWKAEIGGRFDGGDGIQGAGIEAGFRVGLVDSDQGLDVALGARALLFHENDASDYGIGVQVTWDPGEKNKGMVASVGSSYGQDRGGSTSLWDNGNSIHSNGLGAMWQETQVRVDGEIGYAGILTPLGLPGTVMPYSRARWSGYGQEFGVGTRWTPAETSERNLLPATFELEGLTRETRSGLEDVAVLLRMSIPFGGEKAVEPRHSRNRPVSNAAMGPSVASTDNAKLPSEDTAAE